MRAATHEPPESLGPGSPTESGLVRYGQPATRPAPGGLPYGEPPESLGPATETAGGGYVYGCPATALDRCRCRPQPNGKPSGAAVAELMSSCACSVIPAGVILQLRELATQARRAVREGSGCPRCRAVPAQLIDQLADALDAAHGKTGAVR
jgi:hypothetical protein